MIAFLHSVIKGITDAVKSVWHSFLMAVTPKKPTVDEVLEETEAEVEKLARQQQAALGRLRDSVKKKEGIEEVKKIIDDL